MSIYWTWSYPWEANRNPAELDNRFSTMTEVRRVAWPAYEGTEWDEMNFLQGIAGTLELFHRSTLDFQKVVGEVTGHPVAVFQRIDQAGYKLPIDERILADTDTLLVFGLDHLVSEQEASAEEIAALREWLKREGTCLLIGPHHDVGFTADLQQRQMEYKHHGDELVPRQQRFGQYTRSLMKALDVPVHEPVRASAGRRPRHQADHAAHGQPGPGQARSARRGHDVQLPPAPAPLCGHRESGSSVHVLTRQPVDLERPHPFTAAGNREFNTCLWLPPKDARAGHILMADSTIFTTLFGGTESLANFLAERGSHVGEGRWNSWRRPCRSPCSCSWCPACWRWA